MPDINKDLVKALQRAKKKPCNFAVIAKGPNVLKLIVDRKPIKDGALLQAKKECQGNAIVKGVVCGGDGPELIFRVKDEPAFGDAKLRKYITDETKLTLKPRFEITADLQEVEADDDEQEEAAPPAAGGITPVSSDAAPDATADAAREATADAAPDTASEASRLTGEMKGLAQAVKAAVESQPARKGELLKLVQGFQSQIKSRALDEAQGSLDGLRALLAALDRESSSAPAVPDQSAADAATEKKRLLRAINELTPTIKAAVESQPARKGELLKRVQTFQSQANAGALGDAQGSLDAIRALLASLASQADAATEAPVETATQEEQEQGEQEEEGVAFDLATALGNYQAARAWVLAQLDRLAAEIQTSGHEQATAALIEVKAVRANLTAKPDTLQAAQELERYLETDDVVADLDGPNHFGIEVKLQETLLAAVYELTAGLS